MIVVDQSAPRLIPVHPLRGQGRRGRRLYRVTERLRFVSRRNRITWEAPEGYVTDFASVPWWAAPFIDPFEDAHALAAIAHDVGYAIGEPGRRALWDDCFLERMELDGVWPVRRRLMFGAVRLGGGGGYARAEAEWAESFAAADGAPCAPPFAREQGFFGRAHGPQALPSEPT